MSVYRIILLSPLGRLLTLTMKLYGLASCVVLILASSAFAQLPPDTKSDRGDGVPEFKVRPGYRVTRAVPDKKLRESRFIQLSPDGKTLYVSQGKEGAILALTDADKDGVFQKVTTFVKNKPS